MEELDVFLDDPFSEPRRSAHVVQPPRHFDAESRPSRRLRERIGRLIAGREHLLEVVTEKTRLGLLRASDGLDADSTREAEPDQLDTLDVPARELRAIRRSDD